MTGKRMTHLAADLTVFVEGRALDDDGSCLFRMEDGVKGTLSASQICVGNERGVRKVNCLMEEWYVERNR